MCNREVSRFYNSEPRYHKAFVTAAVLVLCAVLSNTAAGQRQVSASPTASELARKNMAHVAASISQVEPVFRGNPGLLLELKAWIAKEAANQGRLLTDADLADDAVFDRLRNDTEFRAVATRLLQRYGYLTPEINPDSPAGRQQEYLLKERTKLQVARESQPMPLPSAPAIASAAEKPAACDPDTDLDCEQSGEASQPAPETIERDELPVVPRLPTPSSSSSQTGLEKASFGVGQQQSPSNMLDMLFGELGGRTGATSDKSSLLQGITPEEAAAAAGAILGESAPEDTTSHDAGQPGGAEAKTPRLSDGLLRSGGRNAAAMVHVRNPYNSIPVLYDMYTQAAEPSSDPKRFGADLFIRGSKMALKIPMDMPAGPDYVIGPGDSLTINMWGGISQRIPRQVDREGRVTLPVVGPVQVAGKTLDEAQRIVQKTLRDEFRDISADISLSKLRTVRVYVVGDVVRPGAYDISALSTALNALFVAGGPTQNGSMRVVRHYRGKQLLEEVDVYDLILKGVRTAAYSMENGDTIQVPPIGPQVTVNGAVRRPALYETHGENTLADVLDLAGGLLPTAALTHIEVQRLIEHESRTMLSVNVSGKDDGNSVSQQLTTFKVQPGDVIQIFPIAPFNRDAVYLQGHVIRPGRYSYHKEMRLSDVVSSYADLLPEPAANYAEIIRLTPPTYAPTVFSFNLADAMTKPASSPMLQPLDTVRIFGRYDFEDAPTVSVTGAVRRPGTYRTAGQVHVSDAIHLAGNLTRDAMAEDAQVVHHQPDGSIQVLDVNLKRAESGELSDNLLLASGDRVLVHEDQTKSNPATVTIQGEVANPGRYPLTASLKVSELIREAGGLKRSADATNADLVHYSPSNQGMPMGQRDAIRIDAALSGQPADDKPLQDGDVLTVRRLGGWDDIGASVTIAGEVQHPGTYGFEPGERLSSVLKRAGGFGSGAYPYGAVLLRTEVREMQQQGRADIVRRLQTEEQQLKMLPDADAEQKKAKEAVLEQVHTAIHGLVDSPASGRVVIHISSKIDQWANTPDDIQMRAGDRLFVPKRTESVSVIGQVYNPTAVAFRPGRSAEWYLSQAGGPTNLANKKAVFVVRADGSVIGGQGRSLWRGSAMSTGLAAGDTVVVPEKAYAGGRNLQNVLMLSQVLSSVASAAYFVTLGLP